MKARHSLRPTCRTTIGSASSCCSQRLTVDFAAGWCRYWAIAIVFLCCTFWVGHCWEAWDMEGGFYIVVASQILVNIRMAVGAPGLGNQMLFPLAQVKTWPYDIWSLKHSVVKLSKWEEVGLPFPLQTWSFGRFGLKDQISEVFPSPLPQCNSWFFLWPLSCWSFYHLRASGLAYFEQAGTLSLEAIRERCLTAMRARCLQPSNVLILVHIFRPPKIRFTFFHQMGIWGINTCIVLYPR